MDFFEFLFTDQGLSNVTRVGVESRLFDQGRRKNDVFPFGHAILRLTTFFWGNPDFERMLPLFPVWLKA